jgi:hypothetical protein
MTTGTGCDCSDGFPNAVNRILELWMMRWDRAGRSFVEERCQGCLEAIELMLSRYGSANSFSTHQQSLKILDEESHEPYKPQVRNKPEQMA